jgi:hypothetical protein
MTAVESCPCNSVKILVEQSGNIKKEGRHTENSFDDTNFCGGGLETSKCAPVIYDHSSSDDI